MITGTSTEHTGDTFRRPPWGRQQMTVHRRFLLSLLPWSALISLPATEAGAQATEPTLSRLVDSIVMQVLSSAGHRHDEIYFATDSATAAVLKSVGTIRMQDGSRPRPLWCPSPGLDSTRHDVVGYAVTLSDSVTSDSTRQLSIVVSCAFPSPGRPNGIWPFGSWGRWELGRSTMGWTILRTLERAIT